MAGERGKTLWEMLWQWLRGSRRDAPVPFYNPLDLRVGGRVGMAHANGPEYAGYDFSVTELREYKRVIGGKEFRFTDYLLGGVNTRTFDADQAMAARIRTVPNRAGAHDAILLRLDDEFAFAKDFLGILNDGTGVFEVKDDENGKAETFTRINDVRGPYQADVRVMSQPLTAGQPAPENVSRLKVEYWDYWRNVDIGGGKAAREFIIVELNSESGWFQIWRGREYFG